MRRAGGRIQEKIRNLIDELHRCTAKWLCENHSVVLLPVFESSRMVVRKGRKINSKTARAMCTLSHYRFRKHLLDKARSYPGCRVVLTQEPYTSKTCGRCGALHHTLGSNKTFACRQLGCGYRTDRDANGARNILLRHLTLHGAAAPVY
jgi:putative transposase